MTSGKPSAARVPRMRQGKYLRLVIRDGWEYVERVNSSGVVIIVALTATGNLLLVEQFRRPVNRRVIAFPAGLVGDAPGRRRESHLAAARRELAEETGYAPRRVRFLFRGPVSAGMSPDMVTFVRAMGLRRVGAGGGVDPHEDILVHEIPLSGVDAWLRKCLCRGLLVGPHVFTGLYFLKHQRLATGAGAGM